MNVTFGQTIAPISAATVSSLMMGFAWGTGGLSVPFVGMLADRIGIERALMLMSFMPLVAAALALPLPRDAHAHATARASDVADVRERGHGCCSSRRLVGRDWMRCEAVTHRRRAFAIRSGPGR